MKYLYLFFILFVSCNAYKQANNEISKGNYDSAFEIIYEKFTKGIKEKDKGNVIATLQTSYKLANENDFAIWEKYNTINDKSKYEKIYYAIQNIVDRQDKIKSYLPIIYNDKTVDFPTQDLEKQLAKAKQNYADELNEEGEFLLTFQSKKEARDAYYNFKTIKKLFKNYPNIDTNLNKAKYLGTTFILMGIRVEAYSFLPRNLEMDLRNINSYNLNNEWNIYDTERQNNVAYDYEANMVLTRIEVSPERVETNSFSREKSIKEGQEFLRDSNGNVLRDKEGNDIKIDKYIVVNANVRETHLYKEAFINAQIELYDLKTNKIKTREFLESRFIFDDYSAQIYGDERALDNNYFTRVKRNPIYFPSNEQMIFDCGQDLKGKMKNIMNRYF